MEPTRAGRGASSAGDLPERLYAEFLRLGADPQIAREVADLWKKPPLREEVALEAVARLTATLPPKEAK